MKKILFFAAVLAIFSSCEKNQIQEQPIIETVPVTVEASLGETKATIGAMTWETGDQITVWVASHLNDAGYDGNVLTYVPGTGKFSGEIAIPQAEDTYYAAYQATGFDKENKIPTFTLSATQAEASNGATKVKLSGSYTGALSSLSFDMASVTAKLKITFDKNIKQVTFAGMNNENLIGENKEIVYTCTDGQGTKDVEFIIPAMTFSNGYKLVVEGMTTGEVMYQSFSGSKTFAAGVVRNVSLNFVPFSISAAFDETDPPMTSYSYYLKGDYTTANSNNFLTGGEPGTAGDPNTYDNDAQGIFTGKLHGGKAKIVVNGASSSLIPSGYTVKEYGYYRSVNGSTPEQIKVGTGLNLALTKNISWNVEGPNSKYTPYDQGWVSLQPYITVNYGTTDTEYKQEAVKFYITGLPHISSHSDLWFVSEHHSHDGDFNKVSGYVERTEDGYDEVVDMFYNNNGDGGWDDFCVRTKEFSIPAGASVNVKPWLYGVLWGGNMKRKMNAYFFFDATNEDYTQAGVCKGFVFHRNVTKSSDHKITSPVDAKIEKEDASSRGYEDFKPNKVVTLTEANPEFNMYLWIYRYSNGLVPILDYPGYWLKNITLQYSAPASN